ncbi:MAG: hypothetical protein PVI78_05110, partial [Anaerolineales bacterium]
NMAADRFDTVMLINRSLVAFGPPEHVFTRPFLMQAYGDQLRILPDGKTVTIVADTCCDGEAPA